jgi:threonyl-tRNA synthetase
MKFRYKEAKNIFKNDPYKLELIEEHKGEGLTVYSQGEFTDLCRGGHVPNTKFIKNFKLLILQVLIGEVILIIKCLLEFMELFFSKKDLDVLSKST